MNRTILFFVVPALALLEGCGSERVIGDNPGSNGGSPNSGGTGNGGTRADDSGGSYLGTTPSDGGSANGGSANGGTAAGGRVSTGGDSSGGATAAGGSSNAPSQAGSAGSSNAAIEKACRDSGGTVTTALCCAGLTSDFPNLCLTGPCSCAPSSSKSVSICQCGSNQCWNGQSCVAL